MLCRRQSIIFIISYPYAASTIFNGVHVFVCPMCSYVRAYPSNTYALLSHAIVVSLSLSHPAPGMQSAVIGRGFFYTKRVQHANSLISFTMTHSRLCWCRYIHLIVIVCIKKQHIDIRLLVYVLTVGTSIG